MNFFGIVETDINMLFLMQLIMSKFECRKNTE